MNNFNYRKLYHYKYQLLEEVIVQTNIIPAYEYKDKYLELDLKGLLTIKIGYAWDGPTGIPDFKCMMFASLVHDSLYQLLRLGVVPFHHKTRVDKLFRYYSLKDITVRYKNNIIMKTLMRGIVNLAYYVLITLITPRRKR